MPKIKLTKGELKRQRDALRQYNRYLPTLQLKKQQLQMEILRADEVIKEKHLEESARVNAALSWSGLMSDPSVDLKRWTASSGVVTTSRNVAGVEIPVFRAAEFMPAEYDLFLAPLWVDAAIEALRAIASLRAEIKVSEDGAATLRRELRITAQRVNLFEKVKIPEAEESIRIIKIYIGDQMANAVGRSKMAKRKIEELEQVMAAS